METKTCKNCSTTFIIEPDDLTFYAKIGVPEPTLCFHCRLQRKMLWRNERTYYRRTCDLCKKNVISTYHQSVPFPVYCQKCWWGDGWDAQTYARDFDFSKPFFDQFRALLNVVPQISIMNDNEIGSLNSEYAYDFAFAKNCYLTAAGWYSEYVMYSYYTCYDKEVVDSYMVNNSELCYELFESHRNARSAFCTQCFDCTDCWLSYDLRGCSDCILCVGLRNKRYCIDNQQYSKEEYNQKKKEMGLERRENLERYRQELNSKVLKFPHRYSFQLKTVGSSGHMIFNSKMANNCWWVGDVENSKYMLNVDTAADCYDCLNTGQQKLSYESVTPDQSYLDLFDVYCWKCNTVSYSNNCHSSNNLFGCVGLKHKEYCILNKQYSKDEYEALRAKIIEHMGHGGEYGEFFPASLSPYGYNETMAFEYFPMVKEDAIAKGYAWRDPEEKQYSITMRADDIPQTIAEVTDAIVNEIIECKHKGTCQEKCASAFKIHPQELQFYRKMNLPLPDLCPNCRHYQRIANRLPPKLWHRKCANCDNEFETSYAPDRPEIVYCEACYQAEVN